VFYRLFCYDNLAFWLGRDYIKIRNERLNKGISNMTESKKLKIELQKSREKYQRLFRNIKAGIVIYDRDGSIIEANPEAEKTLGLSQQELKEKPVDYWEGKIYNENREPMKISEFPIFRVFNSGKPDEGTIIGIYTSSQKGIRWYVHNATPLFDKKGKIDRAMTSFIEIMKQKKMEGQLKKSLKEKEVMLREIHHRVKNNLQIVTSLLRLQSQFIRDKEAKQAFRESQNRIYSMALIHEKLYKSQDLARINLGHYIQNL
jgi:PAS domain-containing protein